MGHKRLSASGSSCWMNCPGQPDFEDVLVADGKLPAVEDSSKYAMEGTAAHAVNGLCLGDMLSGEWGVSAEKYRGCAVDVESAGDGCTVHHALSGTAPDEPPDGWARFGVDDDMIWACDVFVGYIRRRLEELGATAEGGLPPDVRVDVEVHGDLGFLGREDLGGTVDCRITQMLGLVEVVDYKHGRGVPVFPEGNSQLLIYAGDGDCGADDGCVDARLTIVQPRCQKNETIDSWDLPAAEVRRWLREELLPAYDRCVSAETVELVPGERQCLWCRCAPHCGGRYDAAVDQAVAEFDDLDLVPADGPPPRAELDRALGTIAVAPPEKVARFLDLAPFLEAAIKAAVERGTQLLESGAPVPGRKLVAKKANRQCVADAEERLAAKRVPKRVSHKQALVSFTVLEKTEGGKYKAVVDELTWKPEGGHVMVPESDKRPALPPPAQEDFDDLDAAPPEDDLLS
jgi:hypothetical protein